MKKQYLLVWGLASIAMGCTKEKDPIHHSLRIAYVDSVGVVEKDNAFRLSEPLQKLCAVFVLGERKCEGTYILDPVLARLDQGREHSLKTTIEKGGVAKKTNPNYLTKVVNANLEEIQVPTGFAERRKADANPGQLISDLIQTKAQNDSILVFDEARTLGDMYVLAGRPVRVFTDIEGLRGHIQQSLCSNSKASFTVLVNPPVVQVPPIPYPPDNTTTGSGDSGNKKGKGGSKVGVVRPESPRPQPARDGICDYNTHTLYERGVDGDGNETRGRVLVVKCAQCGYQVGKN